MTDMKTQRNAEAQSKHRQGLAKRLDRLEATLETVVAVLAVQLADRPTLSQEQLKCD